MRDLLSLPKWSPLGFLNYIKKLMDSRQFSELLLVPCESAQNHLFLGSICMSPKAPKTQPPSPCFARFGAAPVACIVRLSCKMHQNRSSTLRWSLTENRTGVVVSLSNRIKLNDASSAMELKEINSVQCHRKR